MIWKEFKGVWHDDRNSEGTLLYESGSKYEGQLKNNKRHGKGIYTYPSIEELNQVKANIKGMIIDYADSIRISFSGEWEEDVKIRGVILYRHGGNYKGQLFNDERHGKGVYTYADGAVYYGDFQDSLFHGYGMCTYANGNKYEGCWDKCKRHGIGEYRWASG
jgi:hypothetical protein